MGKTSELKKLLRRALARSWLLLSMIASIGVVLGVAVWSAARERADSLADFSEKQALLATAVGSNFEQRLAAYSPPQLTDDVVLDVLSGARRLEDAGGLIVLVARPQTPGFLSMDRRIIPSARLHTALEAGQRSVIVPRDEAADFGLPRRMAIAGATRIAVPGHGTWGLVVLSSAQRLRDRQNLEERRLMLTVVVVTLVVGAFGVVARRRQRNELELERRIAVSSLEREREAALAKADKMAALAALSTGIAHEVGTPLGVIVGRTEQAIERTSDTRTKAALDVVLEQVERIRRIVRGCLALARGEAPLLVRTPAESLAQRAVALVLHRFDKAGVALTSKIEPDLPSIACEPALFEQALVNLLLNACEATPRGKRVHLFVRREGRGVCFVVDDEGAGIPDAVAKRATEPFFSTRRGEGGSGLGLSIVREIVNHHSGTLTVEKRTDGGGTRATIEAAVAA